MYRFIFIFLLSCICFSASLASNDIGISNGIVPTIDKKKIYTSLIAYSHKLVGSKYHYGGSSRKDGFDCSGLVKALYKSVDIALPRSSKLQAQRGKRVKLNQLRPGDLMFFASKGNKINHVCMVVNQKAGQTRIIHATTSKGVILEVFEKSTYWRSRLKFVKRII